MSRRSKEPNRRRPWAMAAVAALFLLPTFLASGEIRVELAALGLAVALLAAVVRRTGVTGEVWRFIAGPVVFVAAGVAGDLLLELLGGRFAPILRGVDLGLRALGLAWSVLAILRLGLGGWMAKSWRAAIPVLIAYLLISANAGPTPIALFLFALAVYAIPTHWINRLGATRTGKRQVWLILLMTPLAFAFTADIHTAAGDIAVVGGAQKASGILGSLQTLLLIFWLTLPARLLLKSFRHLMRGLSIRMRLMLTYFFSTVVPGFLALVLVGVVMFAGIGTLRARVASNLIRRDLDDLAARLDHGPPGSFVQRDSVAAGLYARSAADTSTAETIVTVPPDIALMADSLLPRELGSFEMTVRGSGTVAATRESWIKLAQRGSWALPDTLVVDRRVLSTSGRGSSLVTIGNGRVVFLAAQAVRDDMARILARPLNEQVAESYKRIVGADLIISPTASMLFTPQGSEVRISQVSSREPVASVSTLASTKERSLFHRPIRQGICELQATQDSDEVSHLRGVVVVRTSLAGLVGSLFATKGINLVVVVVEGVLAALILIALVFSTIIGFSLNGTITSSMAALRHGAQRLSQGDLDVRVEMPARGEMGRLAESFNRLAQDLKRLVRQVAEKERLDRELQIAREIQVNLLPGVLPKVGGIELAAVSRPAKEVAGDYYDALIVEPGRLVMVVADVSGKGIAAAMLMSNLQSALHVLLSQDLPLEAVVGRLNSLVCKNSTPEMFITFFIGVIDPRQLRLDYVNAGHDQPMIIRGQTTTHLSPCGMLLGMFPEATHTTGSVDLQVGDVLALYSDGVTEAMNDSEEEFGVERLEQALRDAPATDAPGILAFVLEQVRAHTGDEAAPTDDLTMLVARVVSGEEERGV